MGVGRPAALVRGPDRDPGGPARVLPARPGLPAPQPRRSVEQQKDELTLASALWILVGAAGVFIPLETALNTLWGVREHRPYWRNQLVGFLLTAACVSLAFVFVLLTAGLKQLVAGVEPRVLRAALSYGVLRGTALALAVVAIFLLFRHLPNRSVSGREVLPAAIAAGFVAEAVRYVVPAGAAAPRPREEPGAVPRLRELCPARLLRGLRPDGRCLRGRQGSRRGRRGVERGELKRADRRDTGRP